MKNITTQLKQNTLAMQRPPPSAMSIINFIQKLFYID